MTRQPVDHNGRPVRIYTPEDITALKRAGQLAAQTLDYITPYVTQGMTTLELNDRCQVFMEERGAKPAPLQEGFPKAVCTSVNHVICHGVPNEKKLKDGDIINIDVSLELDGWYGDTSRMFCIGKTGVRANKLVQATYDAMMLAITRVKPGATLGDVGAAIQTYAEAQGYSVVREFCGHGIGQKLHEPPEVLHYGREHSGMALTN